MFILEGKVVHIYLQNIGVILCSIICDKETFYEHAERDSVCVQTNELKKLNLSLNFIMFTGLHL